MFSVCNAGSRQAVCSVSAMRGLDGQCVQCLHCGVYTGSVFSVCIAGFIRAVCSVSAMRGLDGQCVQCLQCGV